MSGILIEAISGSSTIHCTSYNDKVKEMAVGFVGSDDIYIYLSVKKEIYDEFLAAPSQGEFLDKKIKKAVMPYKYLKMTYKQLITRWKEEVK